MKYIFRALGIIWNIPIISLAWFVILSLWALQVIQPVSRLEFGVYQFCLKLDLVNPSWYQKLWEKDGEPKFMAASAGMVVLSYYPALTPEQEIHELRHMNQMFLLGILFPVLYVLFFIIYYFEGKKPYFDNPFEVDARAHTDFILERIKSQ